MRYDAQTPGDSRIEIEVAFGGSEGEALAVLDGTPLRFEVPGDESPLDVGTEAGDLTIHLAVRVTLFRGSGDEPPRLMPLEVYYSEHLC